MKEDCKCALRTFLSERLARSRCEHKLSQGRYAEKLMIDPRSYAELEHGRSLCCTLTFILYLAFFCDDVPGLVEELREIVLNSSRKGGVA